MLLHRTECADVYHCAPVPPLIMGFSTNGMTIQGKLPVFQDACPVGWKSFPLESGQVIVQSNNYWSGSEFSSSNAWNFNTNNGNQNNNDKNNNLFA
ncbi:MAG: hypothetical protein V3W04_02950, partial [Gammaproteobacteria bacterium]